MTITSLYLLVVYISILNTFSFLHCVRDKTMFSLVWSVCCTHSATKLGLYHSSVAQISAFLAQAVHPVYFPYVNLGTFV